MGLAGVHFPPVTSVAMQPLVMSLCALPPNVLLTDVKQCPFFDLKENCSAPLVAAIFSQSSNDFATFSVPLGTAFQPVTTVQSTPNAEDARQKHKRVAGLIGHDGRVRSELLLLIESKRTANSQQSAVESLVTCSIIQYRRGLSKKTEAPAGLPADLLIFFG